MHMTKQQCSVMIPVSLHSCLAVEIVGTHVFFWGRGSEVKFFLCSSAHGNRVAMKVHDTICSGVVHLPIVKELMILQHTVSLLPRTNIVALLEEEAMAVRISDAQCTQTHIVSCAREMDSLLWSHRRTCTCVYLLCTMYMYAHALTLPLSVAASVNT